MIGGVVIETLVVDSTRVWINTQDYNHTERRFLRGTCAIYVENTPESRAVSEGDLLWWQGGFAYWTPKRKQDGKTVGPIEVRLKRRGYSGVKRPEPLSLSSS